MTKCIKIIFTLSLLLNLVLIGVVGGGVWKKSHHAMPFADTAPETQALFKKSFEENRERMRNDIASIRASRKTLEDIIKADVFDRAAYDAEVARVLETRDEMGRRRAAILGGVLAELPAAERDKIARKIVSKLTDERGRGGHGRKGHSGPDHPPQPPPVE